MKKNFSNSNHLDLFLELVRTDFRVRFGNTILGFLWVFFKPFFLFLIIFLVFSLFFQSKEPHYHLSLLLGVLLFSYFTDGTYRGLTSLYEKSNIILKVNFPKVIALVASVVNSLISFLFGFFVFLIFLFFSQVPISILGIFYFWGLVLILTCLIIGLSFFTSIIYIKLRDLSSIWELALQLLFYTTPIIYPLELIPPHFQKLLFLNPLTAIIVESRSTLISPKSSPYQALIYSIVFSLFLLSFGYLFFKKYVRRVAEYF